MKRYMLFAIIMTLSIAPVICMDKSPKEANQKRYQRKQEKHAKLKQFNASKSNNGKQTQTYVQQPKKKS